MPTRFHGSLHDLKDRLLPLDLDGDWEEQPNKVWKLRCRDRAGMLWSETRGTVWFDGPQVQTEALAAKVAATLTDGAVAAPLPAESTIFVVHGRDHDARDQLELVLRRLGLEPFVLQVTSGGDTLIEALERMIGKSAQSSFGIVLVTPDGISQDREAGGRETAGSAERDHGNGNAAVVADPATVRHLTEGIRRIALEHGRRNHDPVQ